MIDHDGHHLTPEGHEDGIEDGARMVKQVGDFCVATDLVQGPGVALLTQRTHSDAAKLREQFEKEPKISYLVAPSLQTSLAMEFWSEVTRP